MKNSFLIALLLLVSQLNADLKVLAFSGSTRASSYNKKLAAEAAQIARQLGAKVTLVDLKDFPLPFYDADLEKGQGMPLNAKRFRQLMLESDAILIASPNYNGSFTAVLKNMIDWASRSENGAASRDAFKGKKFALMSASPGKAGGAGGLSQLQHVIEDIGGRVIPLKTSVPQAHQAFNSQGQLIDQTLKSSLKQQIQQLLK